MTGSPSELTRRVAWWFFVAGVAGYLLLSAQTLAALGIAYDGPSGSSLVKIHPGTWAIGVAYGSMLMAYGHPFRTAAAFWSAHKLLACYAACQLFVLVWSVAWHGSSGAANIIDTLLMPFIGFSTLMMFESRRRYHCLLLIVALLVFNTLIGLGEALLHARLIPYTVAGEEVIEDIFRPSALLGHPLTNSMITATLLPAVLYLRVSAVWRSGLAVLLWLGVLAFGGRTGFIVSTLAYGLCLAVYLIRATLQRRFSYVQLTGGALAGAVGIALLASVIAGTGIGERIFSSLSWDGSAAVRVRVWNVLEHISLRDMLVGVSPTDLPKLGDRIGLAKSEAIENFWLLMYLKLGWVGFIPYLAGMACAFVWLWTSSRGAMRVAVCLFFIIGSSNNSLATKTVVLVLFMMVVAITRRPPAVGARAGRSTTGESLMGLATVRPAI